MKVVLFCGGYGTRMRDYSNRLPKPLVPIGGRPILWHIMKYYAHFGHNEFILCLGYASDAIKQYFLEYEEAESNDFVMSDGGAKIDLLGRDIADWKITFVDTGQNSNVGERLWQVRDLLASEDHFLVNYSDGLTDHHLPELEARVTATGAVGGFLTVSPRLKHQAVRSDSNGDVEFIGALSDTGLRVNGGYFIFTPDLFDYMSPGEDLLHQPFSRLINEGRLVSLPYDGFWMAMDTFQDQQQLENMYARGICPWQVWRQHEETIDVLAQSGSVLNFHRRVAGTALG